MGYHEPPHASLVGLELLGVLELFNWNGCATSINTWVVSSSHIRLASKGVSSGPSEFPLSDSPALRCVDELMCHFYHAGELCMTYTLRGLIHRSLEISLLLFFTIARTPMRELASIYMLLFLTLSSEQKANFYWTFEIEHTLVACFKGCISEEAHTETCPVIFHLFGRRLKEGVLFAVVSFCFWSVMHLGKVLTRLLKPLPDAPW